MPIVANPQKLKAISANERKSDRNDALLLAKLATADATLLHPVHHRSEAREVAMSVTPSFTGRWMCRWCSKPRLVASLR